MDYDVTVIGAGVVGLATARKLSESYGSVLIVDKEENFGKVNILVYQMVRKNLYQN